MCGSISARLIHASRKISISNQRFHLHRSRICILSNFKVDCIIFSFSLPPSSLYAHNGDVPHLTMIFYSFNFVSIVDIDINRILCSSRVFTFFMIIRCCSPAVDIEKFVTFLLRLFINLVEIRYAKRLGCKQQPNKSPLRRY